MKRKLSEISTGRIETQKIVSISDRVTTFDTENSSHDEIAREECFRNRDGVLHEVCNETSFKRLNGSIRADSDRASVAEKFVSIAVDKESSFYDDFATEGCYGNRDGVLPEVRNETSFKTPSSKSSCAKLNGSIRTDSDRAYVADCEKCGKIGNFSFHRKKPLECIKRNNENQRVYCGKVKVNPRLRTTVGSNEAVVENDKFKSKIDVALKVVGAVDMNSRRSPGSEKNNNDNNITVINNNDESMVHNINNLVFESKIKGAIKIIGEVGMNSRRSPKSEKNNNDQKITAINNDESIVHNNIKNKHFKSNSAEQSVENMKKNEINKRVCGEDSNIKNSGVSNNTNKYNSNYKGVKCDFIVMDIPLDNNEDFVIYENNITNNTGVKNKIKNKSYKYKASNNNQNRINSLTTYNNKIMKNNTDLAKRKANTHIMDVVNEDTFAHNNGNIATHSSMEIDHLSRETTQQNSNNDSDKNKKNKNNKNNENNNANKEKNNENNDDDNNYNINNEYDNSCAINNMNNKRKNDTNNDIDKGTNNIYNNSLVSHNSELSHITSVNPRIVISGDDVIEITGYSASVALDFKSMVKGTKILPKTANKIGNSTITPAYPTTSPVSFFGFSHLFISSDWGMYIENNNGMREHNKCLVKHLAIATKMSPLVMLSHFRESAKNKLSSMKSDDYDFECLTELMEDANPVTLNPDILGCLAWLGDMKKYCYTFISESNENPHGTSYYDEESSNVVKGHEKLIQVIIYHRRSHFVILEPTKPNTNAYSKLFQSMKNINNLVLRPCGKVSLHEIISKKVTSNNHINNPKSQDENITLDNINREAIISSKIKNISNSKKFTERNKSNKIDHNASNTMRKNIINNNCNDNDNNDNIYNNDNNNNNNNNDDNDNNNRKNIYERNNENNDRNKKDNSKKKDDISRNQYNPANYAPGINVDLNILELNWEDLYSLPGLGLPLASLPSGCLASVRTVFIRYQDRVIEAITDPNIPDGEIDKTLRKLALLPTILMIDSRGNGSRSTNINRLCLLLMNDDWSQFQLSMFPGRFRPQQSGSKYQSQSDEERQRIAFQRTVKKVKQFMQLGEIGKAFMAAGQSQSPAPPTDATLSRLQNLYPVRQSRKFDFSDCVESRDFQYSLEVDKVKRAISKSSRGTHCGHDNLSMDIIKQLAFTKRGIDFLAESAEYLLTLTRVLDHVFHDDRVPIEVVAFFSGGIIIGLEQTKMFGEETAGNLLPKVRPIRMGAPYAKIVESVDLMAVTVPLQDAFKNIQYGVGAGGGTDIVVHLKRLTNELYPELSTSKSDFKNAFNQISRQETIVQAHAEVPQLDTLVRRMLGPVQQLSYAGLQSGMQSLTAGEGLHQGGVSSGALYSLAILPTCRKLQEISKAASPEGGTTMCYLDDIETITTVDGICEGLGVLLASTDKGMILQLKKHVIALGVHADGDAALESKQKFLELGIPESQILVHPKNGGDCALYGSITMGIPTGTIEYIKAQVDVACLSLIKDFQTVQKFAKEEPQIATLFLRYNIPGKLTYLLRGLLPEDTVKIISVYNECQRKTLSMLLDITTSDLSLLSEAVAHLPLKEGGLGLASAADIGDAAFVASFSAAMDTLFAEHPQVKTMLTSHDPTSSIPLPRSVMSFINAVERLKEGDVELSTKAIVDMEPKQRARLQKGLSQPRKHARLIRLRTMLSESNDQSDIRNLAMHLSCGGSDAAGWLLAVPKSDDLTMVSQLFVRALRTRLLVSDPKHIEKKCRCGLSRTQPSVIDPFGDHFQKCKLTGALTYQTHTRLNGAIQQLIRVTTGSTPMREPSRCFGVANPESEMRLDIAYIPTMGGKTHGYDGTVSHPVTSGLTRSHARLVGRVAEAAEKRKIQKYADLCAANNIVFVPAVYEVGGRPGQLWSLELTRLFNLHVDGGHQGFQQYWKMKISVALQTGIANAMLTREAAQTEKYTSKMVDGHQPVHIETIMDSTRLNLGGIGSLFPK